MTTTTATPIAERAQRFAVPELETLDAHIERARDLLQRARSDTPTTGIDAHAVVTAAADALANGDDPSGLIAEAAAAAGAGLTHQQRIRLHDQVVNHLTNRRRELLAGSIDRQIAYCDREVCRIVGDARRLDPDDPAVDNLAAEYVAARQVYGPLAARQLRAILDTRSLSPVRVDRHRIDWCRNFDAWDHDHAWLLASKDGAATDDIPSNPWPDDDHGRFRWLVAEHRAEPWCPTGAELWSKAEELHVEIHGAIKSPINVTVSRDSSTPAARPRRTPAAAAALAD